MTGYKTSVKPTGFRECIFLRWYPFFFGSDIEIEIKAKSNMQPTSITKVDKLDYTWKLFKSNDDKVSQYDSGNGTLTKSYIEKDTLKDFIKLPPRIGLGLYTVQIEIPTLPNKYNVSHWAYPQDIADFELYSAKIIDTTIISTIAGFITGLILGNIEKIVNVIVECCKFIISLFH